MTQSAAPSLSRLEKLVLLHAGVLLIGSSWLFGGNIWWMRVALSVWASLSAGLTVAAFLQPGTRGRSARRKAWWLLPLVFFSALVWLSATNPSFRPVHIDGEVSYVKTSVARPGWPSTISVDLTLRSWWFGAGAYLSAFNLVLVLQSRSALRGLLIFIGLNTLVLSVLGTLQRLAGQGFYFGAADSPNPRFFASFIYYNHWGAFMVLGLATGVGLLFYHARRYKGRSLWDSPFTLALAGILLIATSGPVSGSRASTVMAALVLATTLVHALFLTASARRAESRSVWPPVLLLIALAVALTGAVGWLSYHSLRGRIAETREVIDRNQSIFGGREALYRDTWTLALKKPVFGWGLDTYAVGFQTIRPYTVNLRDRSENLFATAHSDWLQSLAETGFAGTTLLILMGVVPLSKLPRRQWSHPLTCYPLLGCALVLAYAGVEFPFANAAVLISITTLFFTTLRLAQLTELASRPRNE